LVVGCWLLVVKNHDLQFILNNQTENLIKCSSASRRFIYIKI